jgi:hypothetical protein
MEHGSPGRSHVNLEDVRKLELRYSRAQPDKIELSVYSTRRSFHRRQRLVLAQLGEQYLCLPNFGWNIRPRFCFSIFWRTFGSALGRTRPATF